MKAKIIYAAIVLLALAIGFFAGRRTIDTGMVVYEKGETVTWSIDTAQLIPVKEETPENPVLPMRDIEVVYIDTGSVRTKYAY